MSIPSRPNSDQSIDWREQYMEKYYYRRPGFQSPKEPWFELLRRYVPKGVSVLEIGGGPTTNTTKELRQRAAEIVGLDIDPIVSKNSFLDKGIVYDGESFPFPNESFNVAISHWVNEHVVRPRLHFREIHRVLVPGGLYIFRTVNLHHYKTIIARVTPHALQVPLVKWLQHHARDEHDAYPTCYRVNTRRRIESLCGKTGFKVDFLQFSELHPSYGMGSRLMFRGFMWYERLVNSSTRFEGLRHTIDCVAIKT